MKKIFDTPEEAVADIKSGDTIAVGGFFAAGVPRALLRGIGRLNVTDLTMTCGSGPFIGAPEDTLPLIKNNCIKRIVDSYSLPRSISKGRDNELEKKVRSGEIELVVYPMGTLAEKYRAAGAGIGAFYVKTGVGTIVEKGTVTNIDANVEPKEVKMINGELHILEYALKPDFSLIHAYRADTDGNLQYRKTARNFNHVMAMAGNVTIVEAEEIVEPGTLAPEMIHTPGIYVQRLVKVDRIEYACKID